MNKEMIKALIDDGYTKGALDEDGVCFVLNSDNQRQCDIPSCLFPDITFENSPVELKTLLVEDEEEVKEQAFIRNHLEKDDNAYFMRESGEKSAFLWTKYGHYTSEILEKYKPKELHKKIYLKDLVKKRKVKKSAWLAVDENGKIFIFAEKPDIDECEFWIESYECNEVDGLDFLNGLNITWEDEPIELTYEVEE